MILALTKHAASPRRARGPSAAAHLSAVASESGPSAATVAANWTTLPGGVIDGGEIVIFAIKPSMWRWLFDSALWLVLCSTLALIVTVLRLPMLGLSPTSAAQLLMLIAFARLGFAMLRWVPTWYVLTNRRIIDVQGVRAARIRSCPLIEVEDTYLQESVSEKVAQLGTIVFAVDRPGDRPYVWQSIQTPREVFERVRNTIRNARDIRGTRA